MKKYNLILIAIVSVFILFNAACKKKEDSVSGNNVSIGGCNASWKVDGKLYEENNMILCAYLDSTLNIGSSGSGGDFQLQITPITKPGTYVKDINNNNLFVFVKITLDNGTNILSNNVSITVSEISNNSAKGTFSGDFFDMTDFSMTPKYKITEGKFQSNF